MAKFSDKLKLLLIDDDTFAVTEQFVYESDLIAEPIVVPKGFWTDFASVPRLGIIYAALGNCAHGPAVIHDWLYYAGFTDRKTADDVLYEAMEVSGISFWRRHPIYWGVRIGGWYAWDKHREQNHSKNDAESITNRFLSDYPENLNH